MAARIIVVVEDLIFLSKIQQTAKLLGIAIETTSLTGVKERLKGHLACGDDVGAVILDLNHRFGQAVGVLQEMKNDPGLRRITVIGFLSHVQTGLAAEARAAGCDVLLARSSFTQKLPDLLQHYAGIQATPAP